MKALEIIFWISLFIVFYTYLGYGILLYVLVKIKNIFVKPSHTKIQNKELPPITLFIAAYNEEEIVDEKMKNTLELDYPEEKLTILWVTDGSNDSTNEKLKSYPQVKTLFQPERQGKTAALNRGMKEVKTPIVVFTDANTMINPNALVEIAACFENSKVGCVAGEKRIAVQTKDGAAAGGEGIYWKYESKLKAWDAELCTAVGAAGELFAIRRELFEEMKRDTLLDDFILSLHIAAQGYKIEYCSSAYAIENGSADMKEEEKRKVRIAAGGLQSVWRLRALLNPFRYKTLCFQYISHRVLRWTLTPILLFALLPMNLILLIADNSSRFIYGILFILQILFYLGGFTGYYLSTKSIKNKLLFIPYYFLFMNINVFKGCFYLIKQKGNGAWEKAKRAA